MRSHATSWHCYKVVEVPPEARGERVRTEEQHKRVKTEEQHERVKTEEQHRFDYTWREIAIARLKVSNQPESAGSPQERNVGPP